MRYPGHAMLSSRHWKSHLDPSISFVRCPTILVLAVRDYEPSHVLLGILASLGDNFNDPHWALEVHLEPLPAVVSLS